MSCPRESDGGCIVVRTTWRVSASSERAEGRIHEPLAAAEETVECNGICKSLGPLAPKTEIRSPRSVHQSYQKLAVLPSPTLHLIRSFSFGFSCSILFTEDERVDEVETVQILWSQLQHPVYFLIVMSCLIILSTYLTMTNHIVISYFLFLPLFLS